MRIDTDPWYKPVSIFLADKQSCVLRDAVDHCLGGQANCFTRSQYRMRVIRIMRHLGWETDKVGSAANSGRGVVYKLVKAEIPVGNGLSRSNVTLSIDTWRRVRVLAAHMDSNMNDVMELAIEEFVEKMERAREVS